MAIVVCCSLALGRPNQSNPVRSIVSRRRRSAAVAAFHARGREPIKDVSVRMFFYGTPLGIENQIVNCITANTRKLSVCLLDGNNNRNNNGERFISSSRGARERALCVCADIIENQMAPNDCAIEPFCRNRLGLAAAADVAAAKFDL